MKMITDEDVEEVKKIIGYDSFYLEAFEDGSYKESITSCQNMDIYKMMVVEQNVHQTIKKHWPILSDARKINTPKQKFPILATFGLISIVACIGIIIYSLIK